MILLTVGWLCGGSGVVNGWRALVLRLCSGLAPVPMDQHMELAGGFGGER